MRVCGLFQSLLPDTDADVRETGLYLLLSMLLILTDSDPVITTTTSGRLLLTRTMRRQHSCLLLIRPNSASLDHKRYSYVVFKLTCTQP